MEYQIENITSFDNDNGSGILARVTYFYEDHNKSISVRVRLPLDKDSSLSEIESRALSEAKKQLRELVSEF